MDANGVNENADDALCNDIRHLGFSCKFDCKFMVGYETVLGCKYLFAVESPIFERMLFGDYQEGRKLKDGIRLPDDDVQALRHFRLLTCCSERFSRMEAISLEDTCNLALFCDKYDALSLFKMCTDRLMVLSETASFRKLIKVYAVVRHFQRTPILEKVMNKIKQNSYNLEDMPNEINEDAFSDYLWLHIQNINYSALTVFTTIEKYLQHNDLIPKNLLDNAEDIQSVSDVAQQRRLFLLQKLLKYIDFSKMDVNAFLSEPNNSNILTVGQKHYILTSLCMRISPIKLFEDKTTHEINDM